MLRIGDREFAAGDRPAIVGVVNVSPESPNQHSVAKGPIAAAQRARRLARDGADIVDVGARSSNFEAPDVGWREELRRIVPVVERLKTDGRIVSVDTWDARVMRASAAAGADLINDSGGLQSADTLAAVAESGLPVVVPFINGPDPRRLRPVDLERPVDAMLPWFEAALERALAAGITRVILDPGTGYARRGLSNEAHDRFQRRVHAELPRIRALGFPLFVALPRRRDPDAMLVLAHEILAGGADFVRAHDAAVVSRAAAGVSAANQG